MRRLLLLLSFFTLAHINKVSSQSKPEIPAQIPTLAWIGVPQDQTTIARYQELRASGITHSFSLFTNADAMEKALNIAQKTGLKMFISCPELKTDPEKTVRRFMHHPALAGYYLGDEPGSTEFPALGKWAKKIRAIDDKHICYLNIYPNYADEKQLGVKTYREYVAAFIKEVPVQVLSFDNYPVVTEPAGSANPSVLENFYENLETFSEEAIKANKPFWAFALTVAHANHPIPTLAALRLQVYSNLAYGAQAIQYFTYWTLYDPGGYDFNNAPITLDNFTSRRTGVYDKLKFMNDEIKNLSAVFLGAKRISVAHTGGSIPLGTKRLSELPKPIHVLKTAGKGAVVSVLEKGTDSFLIVVNRDLINTMKLTIKCDSRVMKVLKDGSSVPANVYMDTIEMEPGDVGIYKWSNTITQ